MVRSTITRIRIVAPPERAREDATVEDTQPGDTIEIVDRPIYGVDPLTFKSTTTLQRFIVGSGGQLSIAAKVASTQRNGR